MTIKEKQNCLCGLGTVAVSFCSGTAVGYLTTVGSDGSVELTTAKGGGVSLPEVAAEPAVNSDPQQDLSKPQDGTEVTIAREDGLELLSQAELELQIPQLRDEPGEHDSLVRHILHHLNANTHGHAADGAVRVPLRPETNRREVEYLWIIKRVSPPTYSFALTETRYSAKELTHSLVQVQAIGLRVLLGQATGWINVYVVHQGMGIQDLLTRHLLFPND